MENMLIRKKKIDYKWVIVVTCFLMEFVCLGFCSSNKSLYLGAITEALEIPRSLFSFNDSFRFVSTAIINLFFGSLLHKFGTKKLVTAGFCCLIASMTIYTYAETVWVFYIGGILLGVGLAFTTTTMISSIIKRWIKKNTGTILGFVLAANGLGGALAAQIVTPIIFEEGNVFGYRNAYKLVTLILLIAGILAIIFIKDSPECNSGEGTSVLKKKQRGAGWVGVEYNVAKTMPFFYLTLICVFLTGFVLQAVNGTAATHMKDVGITAEYVATVLSVHSLALMAFKFFTGFAYDRIGLRFTMLVCDFFAIFVMIMLAMVNNSSGGRIMAMGYGVFSGLALPLETIMLSLIAVDLFGNKSFDKILGIVSALNVAGFAVGAPTMNWCYDAFGSYAPMIWACAGIMLVVTVVFQIIITVANRNKKAILDAVVVEE